MKKIKSGDTVLVIAGKHKGSIAPIESIDGDKAYLQGVNVVKRAKKGSGFVEKTLPLHISNLAYYDTEKKVSSRVTIVLDESGKKKRKLIATGKMLDK